MQSLISLCPAANKIETVFKAKVISGNDPKGKSSENLVPLLSIEQRRSGRECCPSALKRFKKKPRRGPKEEALFRDYPPLDPRALKDSTFVGLRRTRVPPFGGEMFRKP